jgi:hypothetical protein
MYDKLREKRLRGMVSKLNKERKRQAKKVDILCNDLIAAQRSFIKSLDSISFAANFYESIVGATNLDNLLNSACGLIKGEIPEATVAFFLTRNGKFAMHLFENDKPIAMEKQKLENCFSAELVENICRSNEVCSLERMLEMGLEVNPSYLKKISAAAVPVGQNGCSSGFVLIYREGGNKLAAERLKNIAMIMPGLSRAIQACQVQLQN